MLRLRTSDIDLKSLRYPADRPFRIEIESQRGWRRDSPQGERSAEKANDANRFSIANQLSPSGQNISEIMFLLPEHVPPSFDVKAVIQEARKMNIFEFGQAVRNKSLFDFKRLGRQYEAFGNVIFGFLAKVKGSPETVARIGAGAVQTIAGTSPGGYLFEYPFGDDERDQEEIGKGFKLYDLMELDFSREIESAKELNKEFGSSDVKIRVWESHTDTTATSAGNNLD